MSSFIGLNASGGGTLVLPSLQVDDNGQPVWRKEAESFADEWWPRGGFIGALGTDVGVHEAEHPFETPELVSGAETRYGFVGVTRDVYGTPLPFSVVKCFYTATDEEVDQVQSDASGAFVITTPYLGQNHYLLAYKAGTPDVAGTTINTLQPY